MTKQETIEKWLTDCCVRDQSQSETVAALWRSACEWRLQQLAGTVAWNAMTSKKALSQTLVQMGFERSIFGGQRRIGGLRLSTTPPREW